MCIEYEVILISRKFFGVMILFVISISLGVSFLSPTPVSATVYPEYDYLFTIDLESGLPAGPTHVAVDSLGRIYVVQYQQFDTVSVWSRTGVSIANISYPAPASIPQGVATYGNLFYVTEANA